MQDTGCWLPRKYLGLLRSVPKAFGTLGAALGALMRVKAEYRGGHWLLVTGHLSLATDN